MLSFYTETIPWNSIAEIENSFLTRFAFNKIVLKIDVAKLLENYSNITAKLHFITKCRLTGTVRTWKIEKNSKSPHHSFHVKTYSLAAKPVVC